MTRFCFPPLVATTLFPNDLILLDVFLLFLEFFCLSFLQYKDVLDKLSMPRNVSICQGFHSSQINAGRICLYIQLVCCLFVFTSYIHFLSLQTAWPEATPLGDWGGARFLRPELPCGAAGSAGSSPPGLPRRPSVGRLSGLHSHRRLDRDEPSMLLGLRCCINLRPVRPRSAE